jgi:hypothetical protein
VAEAEAAGGWWTRQDQEQNSNPWLPPSLTKAPPVSSRPPLWWEPGYDGPPIFGTEWAENEIKARGLPTGAGERMLGNYSTAVTDPETGEWVNPVDAANSRLDAEDKRILDSRGYRPPRCCQINGGGQAVKGASRHRRFGSAV